MNKVTGFYLRVGLAVVQIFSVYLLHAQEVVDRYADSLPDISQMRIEFGQHKKIPPQYEATILKALSFYPELKDKRIDFVLRKGYAPLSARPSFGGIFLNAKKRKYKVFISTKVKGEWDKYTLKNMPYNPSVGIVGHELGHVQNFTKMSGWQLIKLGVKHTSANYMNRFEYLTDSLVIAQGMGDYLLASAMYAREVFNAPDIEQLHVKGEKGNYSERYMSPATIRAYMADMKKSPTR
ncbi:hypothetical protein [Pollutibacter soli]|uniref:hypothetical protein n=1 Tax=Pollutibacter soli TaxID=3034157 RepID=UPI0030134551